MTTLNEPKHGNKIERKEIPSEYKWHINDIFANDEDWADTAKDIKDVLPMLSDMQGKLNNKDNIIFCLHIRDQLSMGIEKIYAYARLQKDADGTDNHAQFLTGTAEVLMSDCSNAAAFIEPELLALPRNLLQELAIDPSCDSYSHYFIDLLRLADHVLNAKEEAILSHSQLATCAATDIFHTLVGADMTFPVAKDENGKEHPVSEGSYLLSMTSSDRQLRKNTFTSLMSTYHGFRNTLAASLNARARSSHFYATMRKYEDARANSLAADNIPGSLYDGLINTVEENLSALHEYMSLKKEVLHLDELHPYDMYLPLTKSGGDTFKFNFTEAKSTILDALKPLGQNYLTNLKAGLDGGWIDIYENKGKRSGAYSWGVYGVHPYVLLNFQPRYNSVSTLAHEMGHAMHSFFSSQAQPFPKADYTIFCAEVASTTNEILLLEHMLDTATKEQKIYLLNQYLEAVRTTVYRQTQFAEFEKIIHGEITKGASLTADFLEETWHKLNVKYYGSELIIDNLLDSEWSRIPHFYTPFYVYKYATGYSAATTFAHKILANEKGAVDKYLGFLQAGGSDYSLNILKNAGVDLTTAEPIQVTLNKFKENLDKLKALL